MKTMTGVDIDVPTVVKIPEIHILDQFGSSLDDQAQFSKTQRECLKDQTSQSACKQQQE